MSKWFQETQTDKQTLKKFLRQQLIWPCEQTNKDNPFFLKLSFCSYGLLLQWGLQGQILYLWSFPWFNTVYLIFKFVCNWNTVIYIYTYILKIYIKTFSYLSWKTPPHPLMWNRGTVFLKMQSVITVFYLVLYECCHGRPNNCIMSLINPLFYNRGKFCRYKLPHMQLYHLPNDFPLY